MPRDPAKSTLEPGATTAFMAVGPDGPYAMVLGSDLLAWIGLSGGGGDVVGPASAVADRIMVADGTSGKLLKDGGKTIAQLEAATAAAQADASAAASSISSHAAAANPHSGSVPTSRTLTGTSPVRVDGGASGDLSANRTLSIATNGITNTLLRQSAGVSVVGRSADSTGNVADIAAGANDRLLARTSDTVAFQQLTLGMIPDAIITPAKLSVPLVSNGSYVPTFTSVAGLTGSESLVDAKYEEFSTHVRVNVRFNWTLTGAGPARTADLTLPVAPGGNFAAITDAHGPATGSLVTSGPGRCFANTGAQTVRISWYDTASSGSESVYASFVYDK